MNLLIVCTVIFIIAVTMTMTGRGGGNFYVLALVATGSTMYQASITAQFILMVTAFSALLIFHKNKTVDWKLAFIIDPPTDIMAFAGGYFSIYISNIVLKVILALLLAIAGLLMLIKTREKVIITTKKIGYWHRNFRGQSYVVNLWYTIPITALTGLFAGAVGISGGSFKIPLMVLLCGVPMRIVVGTSSAMVALTALMGFIGHASHKSFNFNSIILFAIMAVIGGFIGSKFAIRIKPEKLKKIFAYTTLIASLFMFLNTIYI